MYQDILRPRTTPADHRLEARRGENTGSSLSSRKRSSLLEERTRGYVQIQRDENPTLTDQSLNLASLLSVPLDVIFEVKQCAVPLSMHH